MHHQRDNAGGFGRPLPNGQEQMGNFYFVYFIRMFNRRENALLHSAPLFSGLILDNYSNLNVTSIWAYTGTARPSFMPGLNFHCFTASSAFSSRPKPTALTTRGSFTWPSASTTICTSTVP